MQCGYMQCGYRQSILHVLCCKLLKLVGKQFSYQYWVWSGCIKMISKLWVLGWYWNLAGYVLM